MVIQARSHDFLCGGLAPRGDENGAFGPALSMVEWGCSWSKGQQTSRPEAVNVSTDKTKFLQHCLYIFM